MRDVQITFNYVIFLYNAICLAIKLILLFFPTEVWVNKITMIAPYDDYHGVAFVGPRAE